MVVAVPMGSLMALFIPGYLLRRSLGFSAGDRVASATLCIATSVGVVLAVGVGLNALPFGLTRASLNLTLAAFVLGTLAIAVRRGVVAGASEEFSIRPDESHRIATALQVGAVAALVLAAGALAVHSQASLNSRSTFSELSLSGEASPVVTVRSHEASPVDFRVVVTGLDGRHEFDIRLRPGDVWSQGVDEVLSRPLGRYSVDLFRAGSAEPYRHVSGFEVSG
jgi:hypothetical protein